MKQFGVYQGAEHPCSYLPGRSARSVYVDVAIEPDAAFYSRLAQRGFRRSGDLIYRPNCRFCNACVPVRIAASRFTPDRSQLRTLRANANVTVEARPPKFDEEHYRLFLDYLSARHDHGGMAESSPDEYIGFLGSHWANTSFMEFKSNGRLLAVAVVDRLDSALSAVYTFFDPTQTRRGLGTFAVLWQIAEARRIGLAWVYLGYWIRDCQKMSYKERFRPLEALIDESWQTFEKGEKIPR